MSVKLVIFDMDGVVIDSEKVYFRSNQLAARNLGSRASRWNITVSSSVPERST